MRISDYVRGSEFPLSVDAVVRVAPSGLAEAFVHGRCVCASFDHAHVLNRVFDVGWDGFVVRLVSRYDNPLIIDREVIIDVNDVKILGQAFVKVNGEITSPFVFGKDKLVRGVHVAFLFIDACKKARNCLLTGSYPNGVLDSEFIFNVCVNASGTAIGGCMFNTLLLHNVCNFNGVGISITAGQHNTLIDNTTYMNEGPGIIIANIDTCYIIRHKSLEDCQSDTFWASSIVLNGLKMHVLTDSEIWTSNTVAKYGIRIWSKSIDDYYCTIIRNVMIRDEGEKTHDALIRTEFYYDKHIAIIENIDGRQAETKYSYRIEHVNNIGATYVRNIICNLQDTGYVDRIIEQPYKIIPDCSNLPTTGIAEGQSYICYDTTTGKWLLKTWHNNTWITIG